MIGGRTEIGQRKDHGMIFPVSPSACPSYHAQKVLVVEHFYDKISKLKEGMKFLYCFLYCPEYNIGGMN